MTLSVPIEFMLLNTLMAIEHTGHCVFPEHRSRQFYWRAYRRVKLERSEEDPPLVRSRDGSWQDLSPDFEKLLGSYQAKKRKITLYKKGIVWCAASRDWNPARLEKIVELHEWAHVFHHLGPDEAFERSTEAGQLRLRSNRYRKAPDEFKEQIAQLLTLLSMKGEVGSRISGYTRSDFLDLERIFFELMKDQSTRYHLPKVTQVMAFDRLCHKTRLILEMADKEFFPSLAEIHGILA